MTRKKNSSLSKPTKNKKNSRNVIWGGRFDQNPTKAMLNLNSSIDFDKRLYKHDISASIVHSEMLAKKGIISKKDGRSIKKGLKAILKEIETGNFGYSQRLEDIHMNVESRLKELIGEAAGRLHIARSRNDQVATDFRLWIREALETMDILLRDFQETLISIAEKHTETIMPGYTHLQNAQPVTLGHHLLAYVEMLGRDRSRSSDCRKRLNECPLGAGAIAGTGFPIDRKMTSTALGFTSPTKNSMDSVSDRDFVIEFLSLLAIISTHLSRLSEEIILWSSSPFNFIQLPEKYSTGSSMLPQKRNPDAAELIRGKSGRVIGCLSSLLVMMKGLPLTYSKDMQEDKEPVFDSFDTIKLCIVCMSGMMKEIRFNKDIMREAASLGHSTAISAADWITQTLGKPFRESHFIVGQLVKIAERQGCALDQLKLEQMQDIEPAITAEVYQVLTLETTVSSKNSFGGTAPNNVKLACKTARKQYLD